MVGKKVFSAFCCDHANLLRIQIYLKCVRIQGSEVWRDAAKEVYTVETA